MCVTNTFCGIRPVDVPAFIVAQLIGALAALAVASILFSTRKNEPALRVVLSKTAELDL
jgi:hypothetical protein